MYYFEIYTVLINFDLNNAVVLLASSGV